MVSKSQQQKGRDGAVSKLNEAIEDLNRAEEATSIAPAKTAFGSTSALLPTIRVSPTSICRLLANLCRIRRSRGRAMSNWDWPAPASAKHLTGD